ncbi:hypothetical protein FRIGORI9N_280019 [Frigoribacterium sp. 9N]|nr:hypothetical protein FRIGORI9N_280019 [Frigoribacterium sp. 9N]
MPEKGLANPPSEKGPREKGDAPSD